MPHAKPHKERLAGYVLDTDAKGNWTMDVISMIDDLMVVMVTSGLPRESVMANLGSAYDQVLARIQTTNKEHSRA